jgi:tetratricopeptide (TPR) repeat protein
VTTCVVPRRAARSGKSLRLPIAVLCAVAVSVSQLANAQRFGSVLSCDTARSLFARDWGRETAAAFRFQVGIPHGALITLREINGDLEWRFIGEESFRPIAVRPPRVGIDAAVVAGAQGLEVRSVPASRGGSVAVSLHCAPDAAVRALPACVRRAVEVSVSGGDATLPHDDGVCGALLAHAEATFLSSRQRATESVARYQDARRLWSEAGYRAQAAVASYGVAEQLNRAGRLQESLAAAQAAEVELLAVEQPYFAARVRGARCLLLRNLGNITESYRCSEGLPEQLVGLGEINEAANEWQNQGSIAMSEGKLPQARKALTAASSLDPAALQPLARGRVHMLAAAIASAEGRYGAAFESLEAGLESFERAENLRWQSNALMRAAELYYGLGAWRETALLAQSARGLLPAADAPLRDAAARMLEARALLQTGDAQRAHPLLRDALEAYRRSAVPIRGFEARILLLQTGATPEEADDLLQASRNTAMPDHFRFAAMSALAERALDAGDVDKARELVRTSLAGQNVDSRATSLTLLAARLDLAEGRSAAAGKSARKLIDSGVALARHAGSPELRHLAMRAVAPARRIWIDAMLAAPAAERASADEIWNVLVASQLQVGLSVAKPTGNRDATALDEALSSALLPSQDDSRGSDDVLAAQRELMRFARNDPAVVAAEHLPGLVRFQRTLGPTQEGLLLALGKERVLALRITAKSAEVSQLGRTREVLADVDALLTALSTRETRVDEIDDRALRLGSQLLPVSVGEGSDSLLLLVDDELAAVPFALLRRPEMSTPLVERVAISAVSGWVAAGLEPASAQPAAVDAFVVSDPGARDALSLSPLYGAALEPGVIETALPTREVRQRIPRYSVLREALGQPGAWVHVATHGATRAGLQGYSGLWLLPDAGENTGFVSWLRLLQDPIAAELVVLNACQLGESSDLSAPGAASFASAMSAAGARHVVAARWRVSDAASTRWVEPFYQHLARHGAGQTGEALRQAQLWMRASRMFRHPFYWAGWMHLVRVPIAAGATR